MKPSQVSLALDACLQANQPVILWGAPGIGKSDLVRQTAQRNNLQLRDVRAVLLDPVDLRGLPHVNGDGRAHWAIPEFLPRNGAGIFFMDELNRAVPMVQNAFLQLVLDRKLGEYTLPADWRMVAACNPTGTGTSRMSDALSNRFVHLEQDVDLDDWCKWAITAGIEPAVIAFVRFRPNLLHAFTPGDRAFPSPRSWEFVSRITAQQPAQDVEHELFRGTIGDGAALEYSAFLRLYRKIPSIDGILLNPDKADVPNDPASLFAIASALGRRADVSNLQRVIRYLDRIGQEFAVMAMKDATGRNPALCGTQEFTAWSVKHSDVLF